MIDFLLRNTGAEQIAARIFAIRETLHAPHLLDLEVAQALRRHCSAGATTLDRAREALEDFQNLPVTRYRHNLLLHRIWELRHNATAYDAAYLALAEALGAEFLTRDAALATVGWHRAKVTLI